VATPHADEPSDSAARPVVSPAAAEPAKPPTRRDRRTGLVGRLAMVLAVLVVGAVGVLVLNRATNPTSGLTTADIPALQVTPAKVAPGSAIPVRLTAADPVTLAKVATGTGPTSLTGWANQVTGATGIPTAALVAYGNAELAMRATEPDCHLSWATLAGIGRVESDHGRFGGAHLLANGEESKPVVGIPLDGTGSVRNVPDTDHGRYDGDPVHDHAVGPMQFLPSTWAAYGQDAMGTGTPDPENVNDAALAAAHYLCVGGRDMGTPSGWWSGLLSYNDSADYGQKVFGLADTYARQALAALNGTSH
jgi:membrane-bound lytic murein transglycosylase B